MAASPFRTALVGVRVALRVTANASRTQIDGVLAAPDGGRLIDGLTRWLERGHG